VNCADDGVCVIEYYGVKQETSYLLIPMDGSCRFEGGPM
jgi:hypothetical protein